MTEPLFRDDAYLREAEARVTAHTPEGGIVLDRTVFYAKGGGQPGDSGRLAWPGGALEIATAVKGDGDDIVLVPAEPTPLPPVGTMVQQTLDWDRRHRHMRIHTALHLLSVVLPYGVTGGAIAADRGRLDFNMPEAPGDRDAIEARLNALVDLDLPVTEDWITEADLDARPELVKTMSVSPPRGQGRVRLVRIGHGDAQVDLQPCGGTHVARTAEIGALKLGKLENKGKQNRRVTILFDD
ncbi:alanyl-tRNA editing protein [Mesobacterium sp. TK19101]|uniref:Alanine--tRNA ligase n=1 Tax=Mesobacterium hydrothermale TaxID=3111907 RepID=A0ABU6HLJ1_9RHOB|nr:alanyl-tRNA editing protein [Mesobacterium sp. TK19101]MEC3863231.1 alanyl-tRNA editing protein [Mesobacterium sp. TK19101]